MTDQSTIPTEAGMPGIYTTGVFAGVTAAAGFIAVHMMGANSALWLVLPICICAGLLAALAVEFGALIIQRSRSWDRRCLALRTAAANPNRSAHPGHRPVDSGEVERSEAEVHPQRYSLDEFLAARDDCENIPKRPHAMTPPSRAVASACAGPRFTIIDGGGFDERAAAEAAGQDAHLEPLSASVVDRLFARVGGTALEAAIGRDAIIGYLGDPEAHHLAVITEWAGPNRVVSVVASADDANWSEITSLLRRAHVVFVDADFMGDVVETVDLCLRMRNHFRNSILIVISSELRGNDLTAERSAICDATLKTPLTERSIQTGVSAAYANRNSGAVSLGALPCKASAAIANPALTTVR